jgi:hypothetical protein
MAAQLVASRAVLSSTELVSYRNYVSLARNKHERCIMAQSKVPVVFNHTDTGTVYFNPDRRTYIYIYMLCYKFVSGYLTMG